MLKESIQKRKEKKKGLNPVRQSNEIENTI